jgi:hypothetical protein
MQGVRGRLRLIVALGMIISGLALAPVYAAESTPTSNSTNYGVTEVQFGAGGSLEDCSDEYCARTSAGDLVNGSGSSDNYSAQFGFNTTDEPMLEVITTSGGGNDLGVLDSSTVATASGTISVRNYLSNGYVIQITGSPPKMGTYAMKNMEDRAGSTPGTEQFGINLVANDDPVIGANPIQVPENTFSFGAVDEDYDQPNLFKYIDGDVVAYSNSSTGQTNYTMSMIVNISDITPGGAYKGSFSAVVVPVY